MIQVKKISPDAIVPRKAHPQDAAFDLFAVGTYNILPGQAIPVSTGIAMTIPEGHYGQILGRSGLAFNRKVWPIGGVIDCTYRGEIIVMLFNGNIAGDREGGALYINPGDKIAQIAIVRISDIDVIEVVEELASSIRGVAGFGSSG